MQDERDVVINMEDLEEVTPTPSLNLPDITEETVYRPKDGSPYLVFMCKAGDRRFKTCPDCGYPVINIHGYLKDRRLVHDVNVGIDQVDLLVKVPRYRCDRCSCTFTHEFASIMANRQMTYRLYDLIKRASFIRPFSDVAVEYGYSVPTIGTIFDEYVAELEPMRGAIIAPRVLGIDEKHIVNAMRGVFVDIESGTLLEMTETNKRKDVIFTIENMIDYDKNIKIVTMDMSNGYRSHVQECLPKAKIVVDKYHVYQDLSTKVKKTRTRLLDHLKAKLKAMPDSPEKDHLQNVYNIASTSTYLFKFGQEKLSEKESRVKAMADVCRTFPEFNHLRLLKERFEEIYDCEDRSTAESIYDNWVTLVPPSGAKQCEEWQERYQVDPELFSEFKVLVRAVKSWRTEIFNYFDPGCRVTNAAAEGLNNMIERINRLGNGYSFARLRAKALYWHLAAPRNRYIINYKNKPIYKEKERPAASKAPLGSFRCLIPSHSLPELIRFEEITFIDEIVSESERSPLSVFAFLPPEFIAS